MDLYIIRHAWAGERDDAQWPDDDQRPLTEDGRERFNHVVAKLVKRGFSPDVIASSPLVRCLQTAELVAQGVGGSAEVVPIDGLTPGSDLQTLMQWTKRQSRQHQQIAWVGHAPDVGHLTATLMGEPVGWVRFAKGAVAALRFHGIPEIGEGELRWLVTAKVLGC